MRYSNHLAEHPGNVKDYHYRGGAYIFGESIKKSLAATYKIKEDVFVIPSGSEFSNVEGYRRHADRIWRD